MESAPATAPSPGESVAPVERRRARRRRVFKSATISLDGLHTAIDCVLRDLSDTGARLAVEHPLGVPEVFYLIVRGEFVRKSRIVWRSSRLIGVAFVTEGIDSAEATPAGQANA